MKNRNDRLREKILNSDNQCCFIDRELILRKYENEILALPVKDQYLAAFIHVTEGLTTPVEEEDIFAGRFAMAPWPYPGTPRSRVSTSILRTAGHITWNWEQLLNRGLLSFAEEIDATANANPNKYSCFFADSTHAFLDAVKGLALRWSEACFKKSDETENPIYRDTLRKAGEALKHVPLEGAYDFFSALQSFWFWQMVTSGICGSRDYTPGRMDQYLLKFYREDLKKGILTREEAKGLLTHVFLKLNELCGTATDDYNAQPTPCYASKQYVTLGGIDSNGESQFNELTELIVEASADCALTQPTLNFRVSTDMPQAAWDLVGKAALLPSIPNFFNETIIKNTLRRSGIREEDIHGFDITACNRVNLPGKLYNMMERIDRFTNPVQWFLDTLHAAPDAGSIDEILKNFYDTACKEITTVAAANYYTDLLYFSPDSITVDECRKKGMNIRNNATPDYNWLHLMFSGIATMGDSLNAIEELVYRSGRFTLAEYLAIVDSDFKDHEELRQEICSSIPHFGNGNEKDDKWAVRLAETLLNAADDIAKSLDMMIMCSFYSLNQHFTYGNILGATPDGRHAGEPISENMSPVYGRDLAGPTGVLRSVASLPLHRTICGGLNFKFGTVPSPEQNTALIKSFFAMGGLHIGLSFVDRQTLEDADKHPEDHRTLMVRKYGFSEYFTALSPQFRREIIDRTEFR